MLGPTAGFVEETAIDVYGRMIDGMSDESADKLDALLTPANVVSCKATRRRDAAVGGCGRRGWDLRRGLSPKDLICGIKCCTVCCMATLDRPAARKSLPLSARDMREIEMLRGSVDRRAALSSLTSEHVSEDSSEATVLHAVFEAGLRAVTQEMEARGYAQIADDYTSADRKRVARRRKPEWADE